MRKIREILHYRFTHDLSFDKIARSVRKSKGVVFNICTRFQESGLTWPVSSDMTDDQLETALFPPRIKDTLTPSSIPLPDIALIEQELARKHVTVHLLFREYAAEHPGGMSQASFYRYVNSHKTLKLSMHFEHKGGDILYCDYSGDGLFWIDRNTGKQHDVELFVACLAASSLTYAEVTPSQNEWHFAMSHARAFAYFGGVTASIIPDNLKSAVTKTNRYDPTINKLFAKCAEHYGTVVLPARVAKPRDKGSVESAVLICQRNILAALRDRTFYSIAEINEAVRGELEILNNRGMKDHGGLSRRQRYEMRDKPFLKPLPAEPFRISIIKNDVTVGLNYHIQFQDHFYSIPSGLAKEKVDVHLNGSTVEVYHKGVHCCRHVLGEKNFGYTTRGDHMPPNHAFVKGLTPGWFLVKAQQIGPSAREIADAIMKKSAHPEQGFRAVQGLLALAKKYDHTRIESACARALIHKAFKLAAIKSILEQGLDEQQTIIFSKNQPLVHDNIRGPQYYGNQQ